MSDNKDILLRHLQALDLSADEATVYMELLQGQNTPLRLSSITGISRTKVYRIAENLEKRSLIARHTDAQGTFLVAADPATLGVGIVTLEEKAKQQRHVLKTILPALGSLQRHKDTPFTVRTYEGIDGLKQMCWHELKTKGELLSFGGQTIEDLIANRRWAEKHRILTVEAGYTIREIISSDTDQPTFTNNQAFMTRYACRSLPGTIVRFDEQIVVYNNTVAVYHWRENQKVGIEIISPTYARTMHQIFETYWKLAEEA